MSFRVINMRGEIVIGAMGRKKKKWIRIHPPDEEGELAKQKGAIIAGDPLGKRKTELIMMREKALGLIVMVLCGWLILMFFV